MLQGISGMHGLDADQQDIAGGDRPGIGRYLYGCVKKTVVLLQAESGSGKALGASGIMIKQKESIALFLQVWGKSYRKQ